ncbi:class I SAM-dependent methyltransferase [Sunxiuqinia dokdonensis]|jgi:2-polyprenyl-3-methyl-5-hydroxy-6-metoxy-1,4-benzoquinol methylase|uniref:Methyltransferase domain-containing protein n=1 Tax=Sunxiuqinia dokdonensis TaxID=1409788 RepID=A0A0L8V2R8_9BACT|nr:class I SAM-dependent methyltransferase [Sunxiuqinia dokdonensis]KOH42527.1 methyltransferase domain-containing protein [Sunxiuqinia dokdonensis]
MKNFDRKKHWETIYKTRPLNEVSWFEPVPKTSLDFFKQFQVSRQAKIIDIGGGDSLLVDHLLDQGYCDLTVLDISEAAIERAKERLGERASMVKWIVADAATFQPDEKYDFWHDRAAFHFLTQEQEVSNYLGIAQKSICPNGILVIGTFSEQGPEKCSGIEIKRYSEDAMTKLLNAFFEKIRCITVDHQTPFSTIQNFVFCSFRKLNTA